MRIQIHEAAEKLNVEFGLHNTPKPWAYISYSDNMIYVHLTVRKNKINCDLLHTLYNCKELTYEGWPVDITYIGPIKPARN